MFQVFQAVQSVQAVRCKGSDILINEPSTDALNGLNYLERFERKPGPPVVDFVPAEY